MKSVETFPRIVTDETMRETADHGSNTFPFEYYLENVWDFDFHCIDWHWHSELEFVLIRSGELFCQIDGSTFSLTSGMGIFVNSRIIHRFFSEADTEIPNMVFSPVLLSPEGSSIYEHYVEPVLNYGPSYTIFTPDVDWQNEIISDMNQIFLIYEQPAASELKTLRLLLHLWEILFQNIPLREPSVRSRIEMNTQSRLQRMLNFIHENYSKHITLDDIASSVFISKNTALQIFGTCIHTTPVDYLIHYRLHQAAQRLKTTEKSITDIAEETGFTSSGYFCRKFREMYSMTPSEYRRSGLSKNCRKINNVPEQTGS